MTLTKAIPYTLIFFIFVLFFDSANAVEASGNFALGDTTSTETLGDFNHDGQHDLAVKDASGNIVTVFLANGDGSFRKAGKVANGTNPPLIQMADLNADGKLDRISTHSGRGGLMVALGLGQGKFKSRVRYLKGVKPLTITVGDFNGDSTLDIAAINPDQNAGYFLSGDGNANFTVQATDPMSLAKPAEPSVVIAPSTANSTPIPQASTESPNQTTPSVATAKAVVTTAAAPTTAALEKSILQKINAYRVARQLPALALNATISNVARTHSQNMATGKVPFGHQGFQARVQTLAKSFAFRAAAENVAFNQGFSDPATTAVNGWINSAGHRNNIVGNYNLTGIGVAKTGTNKYYFTQIFWRR